MLLDHRGIGASYVSEEEDYTISMMAEDVIALLAHLQMRKVQLLGFSMGGLVTQAIVTHPDAKPTPDQAGVVVKGIEVRAIVLTSTFVKMPRSEFNPKNMYVQDADQTPDGWPEPRRAEPRDCLLDAPDAVP